MTPPGGFHGHLDAPPLAFGGYFLAFFNPPVPGLAYPVALADITVFALVVIETQVIKRGCRCGGRSSFLNAIGKGAGLYFVFITTSHSLMMAMYVSGRKVGTFAPLPASDAC